jgi:Fic family protein
VTTDKDLLLIKGCVFHYEFEFIHPFTHANGRMGRLWQTVLLRQEHLVFDYLPNISQKTVNKILRCTGKIG